MDNFKILEFFVINDNELINSITVINIVENDKIIIKELSTLVNTYTSYSNIINGKISGYSTNKFVKDTNKVYISRSDDIYLSDGNISINFCFDITYKDITKLQVLLSGTVLHLKPTYKSGYYKDKNIIVILEIHEKYKTYKIVKI